MVWKLSDGYEIREMSKEDFQPHYGPLVKKIFGQGTQTFQAGRTITRRDQPKVDKLKSNLGEPHVLRLGLFHKTKFVGYHTGLQTDGGSAYYMQNSAIVKKHRRKGLYSALLDRTIQIVDSMGYQAIYSRHHMTNNAVLIPKLKRDFKITSFELSDRYGSLVHLTRYKSKTRNKILDYRAGLIRPDKELLSYFG